MSSGHNHGGVAASAGAQHRRSLVIALILTSTFLIVEVIGAIVSGSLALLADAAHMLTDVFGLALALFAIWFASRPSTPQKTYGYLRTEILAAFANALVLLLLTVYILYEAYKRFFEPPEVLTLPMLVVAVAGLAVNIVSMLILRAGSKESLNLKGAYFEVLADALGSVGVIVASLVIMFTNWTLADPIIGAAIGLFIVPRTWALLSQAVNILLEGVPSGFELAKLDTALRAIPGVADLHDLHVWTITSGVDSMSAHLVIAAGVDEQAVLVAAQKLLDESFGITHTTIQVETAATAAAEHPSRI